MDFVEQVKDRSQPMNALRNHTRDKMMGNSVGRIEFGVEGGMIR